MVASATRNSGSPPRGIRENNLKCSMWGWVSDQYFRGYNLQLIVVYMAIFKFVGLLQFPHVIIFVSGTIAGFDLIVIQFPRWLTQTQRSRHFWLCIHFWASEYIIWDEEFCYKPGSKKRAERSGCSRMQIPHALPKVIEGVFYWFRWLGKDHLLVKMWWEAYQQTCRSLLIYTIKVGNLTVYPQ